ncbi:flagellar biosynthetic protein FliO [Pseudorhizobium flavum]|uniref:flagellar biosynthetic protein FliO n=1 Tax=Pseudorhizobium flavum TaxID=1335061 RepID=UPI0024926A02|nr:flagellar biosynthetic protein FliO [Pseudorhizobium flavum]
MEEMLGAYGGRLIVAVVGVAIGLACLVGVLWVVRGRSGPSPFVRGGKNRQPRLQVLDAAAVDTRRRLVLVRRDDTEHLIMIGGPTDIVIESGISANRPVSPPEAAIVDAAVPGPRVPTEERKRAAPPPAAASVSGREPVPAAARPSPPAEPQIPRPAATTPPPVTDSSPPARAAATATSVVTPPPAAAEQQTRREPVLEEAADVLDAARSRVLQGATVPVRPPPPEQVAPSVASPAPVLGSDFERILEEEMASNLASRERVAPPPRPADKPALTGATPEPSLQDEMARIFGEMSVTREK